MTLENEHEEKAKGTGMLLQKINDHFTQPLLTTSTSKGLKIKEVTIFTSSAEIRLKCFWFPSTKKLQINKNAPRDENATSKITEEHAEPIESTFESYHDSILHYMDDE